ncbi:hypothetical protein GGTG_12988 [Gaeumannomyces tritici R3-111a-1]|uniref:Uncharacterized protein n=1 Tax=Gaeumannomyces tritici (strain R3-111a-1) TaxID=644352 RepID=J3PHK8_GAET3|nr:hypothetical protein GGTG_12988 [Gaeumannomyces tritici R3-111a-1]EJT69369.1 hypothetical protein GGTG_12988 [Gaeumannomyces tritici R3-111a-1]
MEFPPPPRLTSPDEVLSQVFTEGGSVSGELIRQLGVGAQHPSDDGSSRAPTAGLDQFPSAGCI